MRTGRRVDRAVNIVFRKGETIMMKPLLAAAGLFGALTVGAAARDIRVGSECTYPPFNYRDAKGELQGFDIDVAREIGKRLNANLVFVCQQWDGMSPALLANKYDLILASMSITDERKKSVDFSVPYRSSTARFVGAKTLNVEPLMADGKPNPKALVGKTVGLQRSSTYEQFMTKEFPGVKIAQYDTVDNLLLDLQSGRIDLAFAGPIKLDTDFLQRPRGEKFHFIGPEINDVSYFGPGVGVALRKDDTALRDEVDAALKASFQDGSFKAINDRYWSFSVLP